MNIMYIFRRLHTYFLFHYWYPLRKKKLMNNPQKHADILYYMHFQKHIDWNHPKDLNEIINFLEFKTDTSLWTLCADKYAVREYVEKKISKEVLVPLYGKWEKYEDIDFNILPQKFVIKMNNGSGDAIIVKNKDSMDRNAIRRHLKYAIQNRFGLETAEPHYLKIRPCIIAEKLIEPLNGEGLIDYKIWCFNGSPFCIMTCSNRNIKKHTVDFNVYDLEWNCIDNIAITRKYKNKLKIPRPLNLNRMLDYAKILSSDFVESRIDFYEVDGHIYFGEITLSSMAGRMDYFTPDFLLTMGKQIKLYDRY